MELVSVRTSESPPERREDSGGGGAGRGPCWLPRKTCARQRVRIRSTLLRSLIQFPTAGKPPSHGDPPMILSAADLNHRGVLCWSCEVVSDPEPD